MRSRLLPNLLVVLVLAVLAFGVWSFVYDMEGPEIAVEPKVDRISPNTKLTVRMQDKAGVRELALAIRRDGQVQEFFRARYEDAPTDRTETVPLKNANLQDGAFELEIKATDGSLAGFGHGNTRTLSLPMTLDTQPPRLSIKTLPPHIGRGGCAVIRYTASEEIHDTGVLINGNFLVPAFLQKDGSWVCIYPFPYRMSPQDFRKSVEITAADGAGNVTRSHITVMPFDRKFKDDKLTITDAFLGRVYEKLSHLTPGVTDPMQCYLAVNDAVRRQNMERLFELTRSSAGAMLWNGGFMPLPRAAVRANFADHRTLYYNGQLIGEASHLGLDLASLRNAEIPAANDGRVVFTGELGVYGNLCLIDHGLGVFSLYAHMQNFDVKAGDAVAKGQIIGRTDQTGLAFGDHLHFGIIVGGIEVTPIEWLDPKWVKNIVDNVNGVAAPQGQAPQAGQSSGKATKGKRRR